MTTVPWGMPLLDSHLVQDRR